MRRRNTRRHVFPDWKNNRRSIAICRKRIDNMRPGGEFARVKQRALILFLAATISAFYPIKDLNAEVRQTAISSSSAGHTAWAIGLETGSSAITEIWVETGGSPPRHLGTFPGQPRTPRVGCKRGSAFAIGKRPLSVPLHTSDHAPEAIRTAGSIPLYGKSPIRDGSIVRSKERVEVETGNAVGYRAAGSAPAPSPPAKAVLWSVATAFNASALAYNDRAPVGFPIDGETATAGPPGTWEALPLRFK